MVERSSWSLVPITTGWPRNEKRISASTLSGYESQLRRQRAREHLSGQALVNLVPSLMLLEPIFKACEKVPEARQTLLEAFTGDAPVYSLLKHPRMLARAMQDGVTQRIRP